MTQPEREQIEFLEELIATLQARLRVLDLQSAIYGPSHVPAHIQLDRNKAAKDLAKAQADLGRLRPGPADARPPYLGLATFQATSAELFFGRDTLIAELVEHAGRAPFLAVLGASGSGKSSVVRAGLVPMLKGGVLSDSHTWRYIVLKPGARPLDTLAAELARLQGDPTRVVQYVDTLATSDRALLLLADAILDRAAGQRLVLVIDQFEELWTLLPADAEQRAALLAQQQAPLIQLLLTAAAAPDTPLLVVVTLRVDFLHRAAEHPALAKAIAEHDLIVSPMTEDELHEAIVRPAELLGGSFEPGLVDELIEQTSGREGALPLLEYTLQELWKRREQGQLSWAAYRELGGLEGALAARADAIVQDHYTQQQQDALRQVLLRLIQPGEGASDTRRRVRLDDMVPAGETLDALQELLKPLTDARLLTTGRDSASGAETIEVTHEALIRAWPTLVRWLAEAREDLRQQLQLEEAAQEWQSNKQNADLLWSGLRLTNALAWQARARPRLNAQEHRFLEASQAAQRRGTVVRRGTLAVIMLLLLTIAGVALFFAQRQQRLADDRLQAINVADAARKEAERQNRLALARQLASQSLIYRPNDQELATLLAMQAISTTLETDGFVDPDADRALRYALPISDTHMSMIGHRLNPYHAVFDPTGRVFATAGADNFALLWDAQTGKQLFKLEGHGNSTEDSSRHDIQNIAFSPSGDRLVTAGLDGVIKIWDVYTGAEVLSFKEHKRSILDIVFHPSGNMIASAGYDGMVRLWDAQNGSSIVVWQAGSRGVNRLAFSQDGRLLAGSGVDGSVWLWDIEARTERYRLKSDLQTLIYVAFSPDGTHVASAGFGETAYVWDTRTGERTATLEGLKGLIWQLVYSPLGDTIVTADESAAWVWDAQTGKRLFALNSLGQLVRSVAFRPDGQQIATGGNDNVVRLWNAQTGALEALLREENIGKPQGNISGGLTVDPNLPASQVYSSDQELEWVLWVTYNAGGDRLVSLSGNNSVDMYVVKTDELLRMAGSHVTRQLSCVERVQFLNEQHTCEQQTAK